MSEEETLNTENSNTEETDGGGSDGEKSDEKKRTRRTSYWLMKPATRQDIVDGTGEIINVVTSYEAHECATKAALQACMEDLKVSADDLKGDVFIIKGERVVPKVTTHVIVSF